MPYQYLLMTEAGSHSDLLKPAFPLGGFLVSSHTWIFKSTFGKNCPKRQQVSSSLSRIHLTLVLKTTQQNCMIYFLNTIVTVQRRDTHTLAYLSALHASVSQAPCELGRRGTSAALRRGFHLMHQQHFSLNTTVGIPRRRRKVSLVTVVSAHHVQERQTDGYRLH